MSSGSPNVAMTLSISPAAGGTGAREEGADTAVVSLCQREAVWLERMLVPVSDLRKILAVSLGKASVVVLCKRRFK